MVIMIGSILRHKCFWRDKNSTSATNPSLSKPSNLEDVRQKDVLPYFASEQNENGIPIAEKTASAIYASNTRGDPTFLPSLHKTKVMKGAELDPKI